MRITKVEFIDQTEDGIFCDITYKHRVGLFFREKEVTRMVVLKAYSKNLFKSYPQWCDDGEWIYISTLPILMKLSVDKKKIHVDHKLRKGTKRNEELNRRIAKRVFKP